MVFGRILNGFKTRAVSETNRKVVNTKTGVVATVASGLKAPITVTKDSGHANISFAASGSDILVSLSSALSSGVSITAIVKATQADGAYVGIPVTLEGYEVPVLQTLTLNNSNIVEGSSANAVVGTIQGKTTGSVLSLENNAGGRFTLANGVITVGSVPTNFETATSHDITIRETLADSANSPNDTVLTINVSNAFEQPALSALSLSSNTVFENTASGTVIAAIFGKTTGSTLSLVDDAGGRFAISGGGLVAGLVALDYETATSHSITIRETLADSINSPLDTTLTINVTNVFEQPNLNNLTLTSNTLESGALSSVNIIGTTPGSTLTGTMPDGLTLNSALRTITGTPSTVGTYNFTLTETLVDSANSPRVTSITITVTDSVTTLRRESSGNVTVSSLSSAPQPIATRISNGNVNVEF